MQKIIFPFFISVLFFIVSCKKADHEKPYGNSLLYMPQAVVQSGGSNNNYFIDIKANAPADTTIAVGLYRSGLEQLSAVSVNLVLDADTLQKAQAIASDPAAEEKYKLFLQSKLMPLDYYTVPNQISLKDNERESYVLLNVNIAKLRNDPDFGAKSFVIPLRIKDPTKYTLNEKLSLTMFIFR